MDATVRSNRHDLQLQKELQQRTTATAHASERVDGSIEVEVGLLAPSKGGPGLLALLTVQVQHLESALHRLDLVAGDDAVGLAQGAHDAEGRVDQLRLHDAQAADDGPPERDARGVADEAADDGARQ